jgi:hypothetical protein
VLVLVLVLVLALLLVLAPACGRDAAPSDPRPPVPTAVDDDASPPRWLALPDAAPPRWIARTYEGYAIDARAPEIRLCADGRYLETTTYEANLPPPKSKNGRACCSDAERGTYELVRDAAGTITAVVFTPDWRKDDPSPAPHTDKLTAGDNLHGYHAIPHAMDCR